MNGISKLVLNVSGTLKPVLIKLLPLSLLRKMKRSMIANSYGKLEKLNILPYENGRYEHGVNLIGNICAESGLGQSCRLVASALDKTGFPLSIYKYEQLGAEGQGDHSWENRLSKELPYDVNLIHINPHELGLAFIQQDASVWNYRYNIGYWLWELEEFPDEWIPCFQCLDEIWAPSEFICNAIRKKTTLPVRCMPYYVDVHIGTIYDRKHFGIPEDKFLYLMMYDQSSCMERKNPIGVLNAFKMAFEKENENVGLVIKINNPTPESRKQIRSVLDGYTNVYLIEETLSRDEVNSLTKCVDVVVSLHRAEGFGLVLAEAMLLGTPTVATNWSSNTEFMNENVACMVDYELITIEKDMPPFKAGNRWADANLDQAAGYMKKLYEDKEYYEMIWKNAKEYAEEKLGMDQAAGRMRERLKEIWN
jgi:glycosyltransferase involved in cell wall biosynthesis